MVTSTRGELSDMNLRPRLLLALFLLLHLVAALGLSRLAFAGEIGEIAVVAIGIVQLNLIAMWGAESDGPIVRRLPWMVLLGTVMWCAIVAGSFWFDDYGPMDRSEALLLAIILSMVLLTTFVMLWLIRPWLSWRLAFSASDAAASEQFNIREMFMGTTLMCIALSLARWMLPPGEGPIHSEMELELIVALAAGVNSIATLPLVRLAFSSPRVLIIGLLIGSPAYSILFAGIETCVLTTIDRRYPADLFSRLWVLNVLQLWMFSGSWIVLRWSGFRLKVQTRHVKSRDPLLEKTIT